MPKEAPAFTFVDISEVEVVAYLKKVDALGLEALNLRSELLERYPPP